jgi:hypothetical protein
MAPFWHVQWLFECESFEGNQKRRNGYPARRAKAFAGKRLRELPGGPIPRRSQSTSLLGKEKNGASPAGAGESNFSSGGRTLEREDCIMKLLCAPKLNLRLIMYSTKRMSMFF